jgi:DNA mismatch repair protein MLH1
LLGKFLFVCFKIYNVLSSSSISHVAHVTITSLTQGQSCAFRLEYEDGKPKSNSKPKPCAGKKGTILLIEDLFYNVPTRKKTIKNPTEEHHKIVEVVKYYAINNSKVSFSVKKHGEALAEVHTQASSTPLDNIKLLFGEVVSSVLTEVDIENKSLAFKAGGLVSNCNYDNDKSILILFINSK